MVEFPTVHPLTRTDGWESLIHRGYVLNIQPWYWALCALQEVEPLNHSEVRNPEVVSPAELPLVLFPALFCLTEKEKSWGNVFGHWTIHALNFRGGIKKITVIKYSNLATMFVHRRIAVANVSRGACAEKKIFVADFWV